MQYCGNRDAKRRQTDKQANQSRGECSTNEISLGVRFESAIKAHAQCIVSEIGGAKLICWLCWRSFKPSGCCMAGSS